MQSVFITGASGYIGRHLVPYLINSGMNVRGYARSAKSSEFPERVAWIQGDIISDPSLAMHMAGCDSVVHLACANLEKSFQNPVSDLQVNTLGTLRVLEATRKAHIKKFIYTSTCQVYGRQSKLPIQEEAEKYPESPYAVSKLCGEMYCQLYQRIHGLNAVILRIFNVYGNDYPDYPCPTVESVFIRQIKSGNNPVIKNENDSRDFIHIHDVVKTIHEILIKNVSNAVLNIGSGVETSIGALASMLIKLSDTDVQPEIIGTGHSPFRLRADIQKINKILDLIPCVSLEKGILKII